MRYGRLLFTSSLAGLVAVGLAAQDAHRTPASHDGLYATAGAAYGATSFEHAYGGYGSSAALSSFDFLLGYRFASLWRISAEVSYAPLASLAPYSEGNTRVLNYSGAVALYPAASGLWVKMDAGYQTIDSHELYSTMDPAGPRYTVPYDRGGFTAGVGAGYDLHLGSGPMIFSPYANYVQYWERAEWRVGVNSPRGMGRTLSAGIAIGYNK